jgi:hypothetical protein
MDFSRMKYRVDLLPETTKCIDAYPDLGDFAQVFDNEMDLPHGSAGEPLVDNDKILRYLIFMYSPNTPLRLQYPSPIKRKQQALKLANIEAEDEDTGEVNDGWKALCMLSEDWAISRFVTFCMIQDTGYVLIANTNSEVMQKVAERLLKDAGTEKANDLKNLREELTKAQSAYQEALENILQQESSAKNLEMLKFTINSQNSGIRMEDAIKTFSERKQLFPDIIP